MKRTSVGETVRAARAILLGVGLGWFLAKVGRRDLSGGLGRRS